MFGSSQNYEPLHTGKKILPPSSRKESQFSLGWGQSDQLNSYQMKNSKNQEITAKIGTQGFSAINPSSGTSTASKNQDYGRYQAPNKKAQNDVLKPINSSKLVNAPYDTAEQKDPRMLEYERLLLEYPDIPVEELQRIVMGYEEKSYAAQKNPASRSSNPISHSGNSQSSNRNYAQSSGSKKEHEVQSIRRDEPMESQKRTPIKPKESMRDIMYGGGEIGSENENPQKVSFRRNNTNLILGDGYNYFKNGP